jgi:hypothetical protein
MPSGPPRLGHHSDWRASVATAPSARAILTGRMHAKAAGCQNPVGLRSMPGEAALVACRVARRHPTTRDVGPLRHTLRQWSGIDVLWALRLARGSLVAGANGALECFAGDSVRRLTPAGTGSQSSLPLGVR